MFAEAFHVQSPCRIPRAQLGGFDCSRSQNLAWSHRLVGISIGRTNKMCGRSQSVDEARAGGQLLRSVVAD